MLQKTLSLFTAIISITFICADCVRLVLAVVPAPVRAVVVATVNNKSVWKSCNVSIVVIMSELQDKKN